jgi:hypothetical protein
MVKVKPPINTPAVTNAIVIRKPRAISTQEPAARLQLHGQIYMVVIYCRKRVEAFVNIEVAKTLWTS